MAEKVRKNDGRIEKFYMHKLVKSIHMSLRRMNKENKGLEKIISDGVSRRLKKKKVANTEDIRKAVCHVLRQNNHHEVCDFYRLVWLHAKPINIKQVIKRDGRKEKFSPEKLFKSVQKSFSSSHTKDGKKLENAVREILGMLNKRHKNGIISTGEIRDIAEYVLVKKKLNSTAKHYILHKYF